MREKMKLFLENLDLHYMHGDANYNNGMGNNIPASFYFRDEKYIAKMELIRKEYLQYIRDENLEFEYPIDFFMEFWIDFQDARGDLYKDENGIERECYYDLIDAGIDERSIIDFIYCYCRRFPFA